jgi:hypothetical protein
LLFQTSPYALQDIVYGINAVPRCTKSHTKRIFVKDELMADAVERCVSRIYEVAKKLDKQAEALAPNQPWKKRFSEACFGTSGTLHHGLSVTSRGTDDVSPQRAAVFNRGQALSARKLGTTLA